MPMVPEADASRDRSAGPLGRSFSLVVPRPPVCESKESQRSELARDFGNLDLSRRGSYADTTVKALTRDPPLEGLTWQSEIPNFPQRSAGPNPL